MNVALLVFYLFSYCVGFVGFGLMFFVYDAPRERAMVWYRLFLLSFFFYLLHKNAGFFYSEFLGQSLFFREPWYVVGDILVTTFLLYTYGRFFPAMLNRVHPRALNPCLLAAATFPLASGVVSLILGQAHPELTVAIMRANVVLISVILALSCYYFFRYTRLAFDPVEIPMMRFAGVANLLFIGPFIAQTFYNFDAARPLRPLAVEAVYYFAVHAANIIVIGQIAILQGHERHAAEAERALRKTPVSFSPRERQIVEYVCRGLGNKQIAAELSITDYTVRNHIHRIFKRLGIRNRVELLALYEKHLID